jgi:diguanylate cyclase (GGDEF)-like protein
MNAVLPRIQAERRVQLSESRLRGMAFIDPLTQLPNRSLLSDRIAQACAHARRSGEILAICYLDLDGFKAVNDTLGHERGDQLLQTIGQTLLREMRAEDTAARVGGDEFVVLLGGIESQPEVASSVQRILTAIRSSVDELRLGVTITVSAGITLFPADNAPEEVLLRHADQAMYIAKNKGRNQYHIFDTSVSPDRDGFSDVRDSLNAAMLGDRLTLLYQPQVNLKTGALTSLEALIRIRDADGTLRLPTEFLRPGLEYDSVCKLDEWVIQHALRQLALWRSQGVEVSINVNINGMQLQHAGFAARLETFLWEYPTVPVGALCLEITETYALQNFDAVAANMHACKRLGVEFAVDDFGTGFSSLTYLRRLPASRLKLDCSYVMGMLDKQEDFAIVEGVLALARAFHRCSVAEGVESELHGELLAAAGCDDAQGHFIARPMPAADVPRWLHEYRHPASWSMESSAVGSREHDGRLLRLALLHRNWLRDLLVQAEQRRPFEHDTATVRELGDWCRSHGGPSSAQVSPAFSRVAELHDQVLRLGVHLTDLRIAGEDDEALRVERSLKQRHAEMLALLRALSQTGRGEREDTESPGDG